MMSSGDSSRWLFFGHPESSLVKNLLYGTWQQKENVVFLLLAFLGRAFWGKENSPFTIPRILMLLIIINAYKLLETFSWAIFGKSQNFQYFAVGWYVIAIIVCFLSGPLASSLQRWRSEASQGIASIWLSLAGVVVITFGIFGVWEDYYYMAKGGGENVESLYANPVIEALASRSSMEHGKGFPYNRSVFLGIGPEGHFPGSILQFYGLDTLFGYSANMHKDKEKVFRAVTQGIRGKTPYPEPLNSYYRKYLPLDFGSGDFYLDDYYDVDLLRLLRVQWVVSMRPISSPSVELVAAPGPNLPQNIMRLWAYKIKRPAPAVSRLSEAQWKSLRGQSVREQLNLLLGYQQGGRLPASEARIVVDGSHLDINAPMSECGSLLLVPYDLLWKRIRQDNEKLSIQGSIGRYLTIVRVQSAGVTRFSPRSPWQHCLETLKTTI